MPIAEPGASGDSATGRRWRGRDLLALAGLALSAAWLFRFHLLGLYVFLGNPDRFNNSLKILAYHAAGLASARGVEAWNPHELAGYDTFSLPYTFPNPFTYAAYLLGSENVFVSAGWFTAGLLALAGAFSYAFFRAVIPGALAPAVGAFLYQCSSLTILKASQNDTSFLVIVLLPLVLLAVRDIGRVRAALSFAWLAVLLAILLHFCFLQKVAYALMLSGAYAAFLGWRRRSWLTPVVFLGAGCSALALASPRVAGVALTMAEYTRPLSSGEPYRVPWAELSRWFDDRIFGASQSDAVAIGNSINLSEGFLLYCGAGALMLLCLSLPALAGRGGPLRHPDRTERLFFLGCIVAAVLAVCSSPGARAIYLLFWRMDFIHARLLLVALLPIALLVAVSLFHLFPKTAGGGGLLSVAAIVAGLALGVGIEALSQRYGGQAWEPGWGLTALKLKADAVVRILVSGLALVALVRLTRRGPDRVRQAAFHCLCAWLAAQPVIAADRALNSSSVLEPGQPFFHGDWNQVPRLPSGSAPGSTIPWSARLDSRDYRAVFICPRESAGGMCAASLAQLLGLRSADGYYGLGVPKRIAALPWGDALQKRHVFFLAGDRIPWSVLALLNVRYAIVVTPELYGQWLARLANGREPAFDGITVLENPAAPLPRAFLAESLATVDGPEGAVRLLFEPGAPSARRRTVIEAAFDVPALDASGAVNLVDGADSIELEVNPSRRARFLVLNELVRAGWSVTVDGVPATIHAVNAYMQGVLLPPGANKAMFRFTPFVGTDTARYAYALAVLLFLAGVGIAWRYEAARPRASPGIGDFRERTD